MLHNKEVVYFTSRMTVAGEVSDQGDEMGNRDHPSAFQMCTGASSNAASSVAHSGCDQPTMQAHILDIIWHGTVFCSQMDPIRKIVWYSVYWPEHWLRERCSDSQRSQGWTVAELGPTRSSESHLWGQAWAESGKSRPHILAQMFLRGERGKEGGT